MPSHQKQKTREKDAVDRWHLAEFSIMALQDYGQGVRGRPTAESVKRTEAFCANDPIFKQLSELGQHDVPKRSPRGTYRDATLDTLRRFDKIQKQLPKLLKRVQGESFEDTRIRSYRLLAICVYNQFLTKDFESDPGRLLGIPYVEETPLKNYNVASKTSPKKQPTEVSIAKTQELSAPVAEVVQEVFVSEEPKQEELEEEISSAFEAAERLTRLLNDVARYETGNYTTLLEFDTLFRELQSHYLSENDAVLRQILEESFPELLCDDKEQAQKVGKLAPIVAMLDSFREVQGKEVSYRECAVLIEMLHSLIHDHTPNGISSQADPIALMRETAILSPSELEAISAKSELYKSVNAITQGILDSSESWNDLSAAQIHELNSSVLILESVNSDQRVSVKHLKKRLVAVYADTDQPLEYFACLATLAERRIPVEPLLDLPKETKKIIVAFADELRRGDFDRPGHPADRSELLTMISQRCDLAAYAALADANQIEKALSTTLTNVSVQKQAELRLLTSAVQVAIRYHSNADVMDAGADLRQLLQYKGEQARRIPSKDLYALVQMVVDEENPRKKLAVRSFIKNLATLAELNVIGVDRLIKNTVNEWQRFKIGHGEFYHGFFHEAEVACKLIRAEYYVIEVSTPFHQEGFEFDIIAEKARKAYGIEVKKQLSTLAWKDDEDIRETQLYRFTKACIDSTRVPVVIVSTHKEDGWSDALAQKMLHRVYDALLTKPAILDSNTFKAVV